jgi:hypothetical protein
MGSSSSSTDASGTSSGAGPTSESSESATTNGELDSSSTDSSSTGSDTDTVGDDPYVLCQSADDELECEAVEIPSSRNFASPSCQWRDVYVVSAEPACSLIDVQSRCVLFFGSLQGCGGPGCRFPNAGEHYVREVEGVTEILIYPEDDVCGPLPEASPAEPAWTSCAEPVLPECECLCELL